MDDDPAWCEGEQPPGPPLVPPVEPGLVDAHRRATYLSYETFLRERLATLDRERASHWPRDYSSPEAYARSVAPLRERLKAMLGFWIEPAERGAPDRSPGETLAETETFRAQRFRFAVRHGLDSYAVELIPKTPPPWPGLIVQHGYSGTPELACGLTAGANDPDYAYRSLGIRAARRGFYVLAPHHPTGYGQDGETVSWPLPGFPNYPHTYGKNRLHRLATLAGGTLFGLDMLTSSRGVDLLAAADGVDPARIGMYGLSQGGQSALFLPALDPRVRASVCSAYFNSRTAKLIGPHRALTYLDSTEEDKFFTEVVRLFSDAEIVSLIAPRAFAVEAGQRDSSVDFEGAQAEFALARRPYERLGIADRIAFFPHQEGHVPVTRAAFDFLQRHLAAPAPEGASA